VNVLGERLQAARILIRVEGGAYSSRLLGSRTGAGVRARVLGVLRWQRLLDAVLQPLCRRPLERLDPAVRHSLRIGLFESGVLGVDPAVATDCAVRMVRRLGCSSAAGLVNAVLRRAHPQWQGAVARAPVDLRFSHPGWLYRRWAACFGAERAAAILESNQAPAPLWVWFFDDRERVDLAAGGTGLVKHPWCPGAWSAPDDATVLARSVAEGRAYAQDPSSQLIAQVAARAVAGGRLADLCAAPGGKVALMCSMRCWDRVVAVDLRVSRARLVGPLVARVTRTVAVAVADGMQPPLREGEWDLVLVDAPCSGTGTLCRHPELRWRLNAEAIAGMAELQARMITAACQLVAEGGLLLFSTCSIEAEENEDLFESAPDGFVIESLEEAVPEGTPAIATSTGGLRVLPSHEADGFTFHALRRLR
jgi:16S rRNA (cytosine967-C5)-methyltransferase